MNSHLQRFVHLVAEVLQHALQLVLRLHPGQQHRLQGRRCWPLARIQ